MNGTQLSICHLRHQIIRIGMRVPTVRWEIIKGNRCKLVIKWTWKARKRKSDRIAGCKFKTNEKCVLLWLCEFWVACGTSRSRCVVARCSGKRFGLDLLETLQNRQQLTCPWVASWRGCVTHLAWAGVSPSEWVIEAGWQWRSWQYYKWEGEKLKD